MKRKPATRPFARCVAALLAALLVFASVTPAAAAQRLRDLTTIQGVRPNQMIGYGIVVGLDGTGDQTTQTPFTVQSILAMLSQLGVNLPAGTNLQLKNVAAVMVTAVLPPFARPGQQVDITVSSMGNAKSLRGGTLLLTPLKGADGRIYAMAQGNVLVGGAGASQGGSSVQVNQLSAGRIPAGATVERAVATDIAQDGTIRLEMDTTDFDNARRVAAAINNKFGAGTASALDARQVEVRAPATPNERVAFLGELQNLTVEISTGDARVIINARTGSVVMTQMVTIETCAIAHGNLSVTIQSTPVISQPNALSTGGQTVVTEKTDIQIKQDAGNVMLVQSQANLADVVKALNTLGATPQDLLAILQAMKAAGALRAELEII